MFKAFLLLVGTVIGAGVFGLPFLIYKVGLQLFIFLSLIALGLVLIIHKAIAQVTIATAEKHRLPGFAKIYFSPKVFKWVLFENFTGMELALLVYIILGGSFLNEVLTLWFQREFTTLGPLLFFALGAVLIYFKISTISKAELLGFLLFLFSLGLIFSQSFPYFFDISNFNLEFEPSLRWKILALGFLLSSFWGLNIVPEVTELLDKNSKKVKRIFWISYSFIFLYYLIFAILVYGISGPLIISNALSSLKYFFEDWVLSYLYLFGFFACFTSFLTIGFTAFRVLNLDLKLNSNQSFLIALGLPLAFYLLGLRDFIYLFSFLGGFFLTIEGFVALLLYLKVKSKLDPNNLVLALPNFMIYFLIVLFLSLIFSFLIFSIYVS